MIFRRELAAQIVKGEKTATRRGVVFDNERAMWRIEKPWRYPVGKVFAVQPGRGVDGIAEAIVTARWVEPLAAVTPADARREGFPTRDAFVQAFKAINGSWDPDARVHVVEFELHGEECQRCEGGGQYTARDAFDKPISTYACPLCLGSGVTATPGALALVAELERESG